MNRTNLQPLKNESAQFEATILPHLDAAYNLARWLAGNENDARDMVQEASLRAFKFFGGFRGGDPRAWLLKIVRNTVYTWLQRRRTGEQLFSEAFSEETYYPTTQNTPALSSYFELMDKLLPGFLNTLSTQKIRGTRFLIK